jgi:hypothetical protein
MKNEELVGRRRALGLFALGGAALLAASCSGAAKRARTAKKATRTRKAAAAGAMTERTRPTVIPANAGIS